MVKKITVTRIMAIIGTVIIWLPIAAPIVFSTVRYMESQRFLFDYLMPAEPFPLVLVGGGLLIWAAFRALFRQRIITWAFIGAIAFLIGGQAIAVATGVASGNTEATGLPWALVIGSIVLYILAVIFVGINGIILLRDINKLRSCKVENTPTLMMEK
jgi:hypothetical protein